jgi:hypothetical protein
MYELSSGYLRDNFGMRVYVFYFVPSDVCLEYPPSNELEWNIEYRMQIDIYLFLQIMFARLRMCIFFCTFAAKINNHGKNGTRMDDRDSSER